jgi:hypothetical protein
VPQCSSALEQHLLSVGATVQHYKKQLWLQAL